MKAQYRTSGRTRASRPPPLLGLDLHFHSFASLSPSDTPPGVGLLTFLYSPLYGLSPWLPTPGPAAAPQPAPLSSSAPPNSSSSFQHQAPPLPSACPALPSSFGPRCPSQAPPPQLQPAPHLQAPPSFLTSPGRPPPPPPQSPVPSSPWPTPFPLFPSPAPPLPRAAPPPCSGSLGEHRAAASSLVAGLNEACRSGATATTALRPELLQIPLPPLSDLASRAVSSLLPHHASLLR